MSAYMGVSNELGKDRSKIVFIGNIPFEVTEVELKDIFQTVGPVVALQIIHDRETGKPRGHALCEFVDSDTAQSAVRNLNGHEVRGRLLRVSPAEDDKSRRPGGPTQSRSIIGASAGASGTTSAPSSSSATGASSSSASSSSTSSQGPEQITQLIKSMSPENQLEVLAELKSHLSSNPALVRHLFTESPQLAAAVLQLLVLFGFVTRTDVEQIVPRFAYAASTSSASSSAPMPGSHAYPYQHAGPSPSPYGDSYGSAYGSSYGRHGPPVSSSRGYSMEGPPLPNPPPLPTQARVSGQPPQQGGYAPPPPPSSSSSSSSGLPASLMHMSEQQREMLRRVLSMSQDQIALLPEQIRAQVRDVQAHIARTGNNIF